MNKKFLTGLVFFTLSLSSLGKAAVISTKVKAEKQIGTYVGFGTPFPSLLGVNAAYNFSNNLRGVLGYGEIEVTTSLTFNGPDLVSQSTKATTYAVGADYLFTDWAIRPIAGVRAGYFNIKGDGDFSVQGFDKSTFLSYVSAGFDYVGSGGYYFGIGLNQSFIGKSASSTYANMGYFF